MHIKNLQEKSKNNCNQVLKFFLLKVIIAGAIDWCKGGQSMKYSTTSDQFSLLFSTLILASVKNTSTVSKYLLHAFSLIL